MGTIAGPRMPYSNSLSESESSSPEELSEATRSSWAPA